MRRSIDELDKDSLKELRGMLLDMKKAEERIQRSSQRIQPKAALRLSFNKPDEPELPPELFLRK